MKARYYQQKAIDLASKENFNGILCLPTGAGKSLVVSGIAKAYQGSKILILQPNKEILEQNLAKILACVEEVGEVGVYSASLGRKEIKRITLATIGSIKKIGLFSEYDIIFVDECHLVNSKAGMYERLFKYLNPKIRVGLTATPYRLNDYGVLQFIHRTRPKIFNDIEYCYQIKDAVNDGFLVKPTYTEIGYNDSLLEMKGRDFDGDSIVKVNKINEIHQKVITIVKGCRRKHIIIFTSSIEEAEELTEHLDNAVTLSSRNSKGERRAILDGFRNGKIRIVCNVGILTTGFDFPALDCVIGIRPTTSLALYYQMVGRGVRICEGKSVFDYFDLVGNVKRFGKIEDLGIFGKGDKTVIYNGKKYLIDSNYRKRMTSIKEGGRWIVTFGKYKGRYVKDLPLYYIDSCLKLDSFKYRKELELEKKRRALKH